MHGRLSTCSEAGAVLPPSAGLLEGAKTMSRHLDESVALGKSIVLRSGLSLGRDERQAERGYIPPILWQKSRRAIHSYCPPYPISMFWLRGASGP